MDGLITVVPSGWKGQAFRIQDNRRNAISIYPMCEFGIQYVIGASGADIESKPGVVFKGIITDILDFFQGRKVAYISEEKGLFKKKGWKARLIPLADAGQSKYAKGCILSWNGKSDRNVPANFHFLPQENPAASTKK